MDIDYNLNDIKKISYDTIFRHLKQYESVKNIVLTKSLSRLIDEIFNFNEFKKNDVNKIFFLENQLNKTPTDVNTEWIYIIRPRVQDIRRVCNQIKADIKNKTLSKYPYTILFSPRKFHICDTLFEQEGIYEHVSLSELENDLNKLDVDLLSMENPEFFSNYYMSGDQTWLISIAKSLINIQELYGTIPNIHIHGSCSKAVYELVERINSLNSSSLSKTNYDYKIGHLILVDRSIDYITPFCSQLTYEGLLDDSFNIDAGYIEVPDVETNKTKLVKLFNQDQIYEQIRTMYVSEIFVHLKKAVRLLKDIREKRNELNSLNELKEFIRSDLKDFNKYYNTVNLHLNLSDIVLNQRARFDLASYLQIEHQILRKMNNRQSFEYIEEIINRKLDIYSVLRLMILFSKTNDGLSISDYNQLTAQFLHSYGYEKSLLLRKLKRIGLFDTNNETNTMTTTESNINNKSNFLIKPLINKFKFTTNYGNIAKKLEIIPNDLDKVQLESTRRDVDMSYAFNGQYRPILCKYISHLLFGDHTKLPLDELSKLLPGEYEYVSRNNSARKGLNRTVRDRTVLIYFVGGCTFLELAVLKKLAKQKDYTFVFATTSFLNIKTLIDQFEN